MALFQECARAEGLRRSQAIERMIGKHALRVLGPERVREVVRTVNGDADGGDPRR